ncbi:hypothetical protein [Pontimicrobium aquaticum]|uniref:NlpE C-terminal OB domain-containing protein n=1 Tax=Pontimicrobium aquaticum TaxID=2565367 RepID=A0A4U0F134_9FLAO|nr:hypothetical protein [Pontimicrobium aquaticum]TJY38083.1 hypothetical protein E5167_02155 [Pontimicrobium aquaticum]
MKKLMLLLAIIAFIGCKKETKSVENSTASEKGSSERTEKQNDGLTLLKGDFIYYADAAVLQTHNEIYGVIINEKMHELNEQVKQYKKADTDMASVEIRGIITPKPENEEGWPLRVEIKEILNVSKPNPEGGEMITIGKD